MALRLFLPRDAGALALGAESVAVALRRAAEARGVALDLVRTGSRGLYWLEPLLEVATAEGRVGYGPMTEADVEGVLAAILGDGVHRLRIGRPEEVPFLARQERLVFARCGITDPRSLADYRAQGGMRGLERARSLGGAGVIAEVERSGLRGRGGAGFPAAIKLRAVAGEPGPVKHVVCNADEGDSGTFADRMLMEGDPFLLLEGMAIAAFATGATQGHIYIRSEYPHAIAVLGEAVALARAEGWLGAKAGFDIRLFVGAGAYICGEETALLDSLEGKRGQVRAKPPLPVQHGLFGQPTLVNNVITLASLPGIVADGGEAFAARGVGRSRGTMPIQLAGNVARPGLFEGGFGLTLGELVEEIGGGTRSGRPVRAVQVGGPLGAYFPPALFDTPFDFEAFAAREGMIGHGGIVVFDDTVDMAAQARFAMEFCAVESCGKCTPCRVGAVRGQEVIDSLLAGRRGARELLLDLCQTMKLGSLCALGGLTPLPVLSALRHFPEDFSPRALAAE